MELKSEKVSVKSDQSLTADWVIVNDAQLIEDLASDYNQYLNFDLSKDEVKFFESVEDMLTKLDEFCALTDMIRSDISLCLTKTLPGIEAKCRDMEAVFDKIDKLEAFISIVRQNISQMEEQVSRVEEEHSSFGGIMKKLTSIVSPKRKHETQSKSQQAPGFQPLAIFNTNDYFSQVPTTSATGVKQTVAHTDNSRQNITHKPVHPAVESSRDMHIAVESSRDVHPAVESSKDVHPSVESPTDVQPSVESPTDVQPFVESPTDVGHQNVDNTEAAAE
ncbi:biogenesis of lysosome-related organelles complex 1 subunit 4-like [Gigantopelta aegis]|uniref:biogenesis of lysosome-related organelles complex 1 subunit 4-like n=1 Tax=Gigantopelta aegis TaxID=1735272 RepID=UPI001B88B10F|nr:biogenesis of lysosome-related organelles complex 1 subunit 4-like [Gigantopelta aegis]